MVQPRLPAPRLQLPRDRSKEKPGDVSRNNRNIRIRFADDYCSYAKSVVEAMMKSPCSFATTAMLDTIKIACDHQSKAFQIPTGIVRDVYSVAANMGSRKARSTR